MEARVRNLSYRLHYFPMDVHNSSYTMQFIKGKRKRVCLKCYHFSKCVVISAVKHKNCCHHSLLQIYLGIKHSPPADLCS